MLAKVKSKKPLYWEKPKRLVRKIGILFNGPPRMEKGRGQKNQGPKFRTPDLTIWSYPPKLNRKLREQKTPRIKLWRVYEAQNHPFNWRTYEWLV